MNMLCLLFFYFLHQEEFHKGPSIKYVSKIFRKTNIFNPWYAHVRVRIRGLAMLVFRKILRTYLMDDPQSAQLIMNEVSRVKK